MELSREEVLHIARLSRLGVSDEEVTRMSRQLSDLLEHFQNLQQVDTEGVPPTAQSIDIRSVMRDDVIAPSLSPEEVLSTAPRREEDYFHPVSQWRRNVL